MWIEAAWHDPRLTYDETIAPGPLRVGADEVWTPSFHAANTMTPEELQLIKRLPVSVASDGTVVARWRVGGEFLCEMNIRSYPYDGHTCAIELAAGATTDEVALVADLGFEVADGGPEGWYQPVWIASTGLGGPDQTSELSISAISKSIRLIFGRIDRSRRVLEAHRKSLVQIVRLRAH